MRPVEFVKESMDLFCIICGPILVSRIGDETYFYWTTKGSQAAVNRPYKGCWFILTAGWWSWKLISSKECVTTHLPNELAPKMDVDKSCARYCSTGGASDLYV